MSCCADLDVSPTAAERRAIGRHLPRVAALMAVRDGRWRAGAPPLYAGDPRRPVLARPGRRCVFAFVGEGGLRCSLHDTAERSGLPVAALKPSPCRLFPLALLEHGGRTILTASLGPVGAFLGAPPEKALACLPPGASDLPPLYVSCREAIEELYGRPFYRRLARLAERRLTGDAPPRAGRGC